MIRYFLACLLAICSLTHADGLIIIHDPPHVVPGHFRFAPLEVTYHRVNVTIDNNVATTKVDQEFYNSNSQNLEGTYIFPLPDGATIDKFTMDINGKPMEAELLDAAKARSIYEEIVRKQKDPALLEYVGRGAFKVRIFPIEGRSRKRIQLQYTQLIKPDAGVSEYVYTLNTEKFSSRPLKDVSVKVEIVSDSPIKSVYCPSHRAEIRRDGEKRAVVGYEDRNVRPDTDFKVIWSQDAQAVGMNLLTWQLGANDGYFMLMASPGASDRAMPVQAKDVCFVIDTSGSMAGPKMDQAKKALRFCLANLNPEDRFEIVRFSTEADSLFNTIQYATKENVAKAQGFVEAFKPIGGTAISEALQRAVDLDEQRGKSTDRPYVVIFLTDGQPTIGERNEDRIITKAKEKLGTTKIFSFGIGSDVNTHLLDRISNDSNAFAQYVLAEEDIEVKVSNFYSKIRAPVLTQVKLALDEKSGVRLSQIYPSALPDLYLGDTLIVFGRYSGSGEAQLTLSGMKNGEKSTVEKAVRFEKETARNGFIPRLWATRRVGWLLDEIRLRGESKELKDEIVRLARDHGIVTPYTSYLILEDEARRNVPLSMQTQREFKEDVAANARARDLYESGRKDSSKLEVAGERAVQNAQSAGQLKRGETEADASLGSAMAKSAPASGGQFAGAPATQPLGYRATQNYAQQARVVNGRAFYQNGRTWTDAEAQARKGLKERRVAFNSEDYFNLLKDRPEVAQWLALGEEVDLVIGDELVVVR